MPWVKSFDIDDVTNRAMNLFWSKGFESTSITNLTKHTGINKGSLYNAFGSKKALFKLVLLKYDLEQRQATLLKIKEISDPLQAIDHLFALIIEQSLADKEKKGCFLVNTAIEVPHHDDDIREIVKLGMDDFIIFFVDQLNQAKITGILFADTDVQACAKTLLTLVVGMRVLARGTFEKEDLLSIQSQALFLIHK